MYYYYFIIALVCSSADCLYLGTLTAAQECIANVTVCMH